jgi:light-regulated signal transduction histidine kinase (bacteriophytochrome)
MNKKLKISKEKIEEYNRTLEKQVVERTQELNDKMEDLDRQGKKLHTLNNQLQQEIIERKQVEDELKRSNTELQQFAYVASHDLQEPLRMVSSYMQLLEKKYEDKLDETAKEFIAFAVDGATRMQGLIDDLLTYSRVGTKGKLFEPTDSESVLISAQDNLKVAIEESGAIITHNPLPTVNGDASQLVQLMQNLIGNGIKFNKGVTPQINISAASKNNKWLFSVSDNGIGIDPNQQERIFQIFQRLHNRTEYSGTGVGLAVCKKIVERHGGNIWVESEPGQGSTFFFTIPENGGE